MKKPRHLHHINCSKLCYNSFLLFCIFLFLLCPEIKAQHQSTINFEDSYEEAILKAREEGKLIFIDASARYCQPCKLIERDVFTQPKVYNKINKYFVSYQMDIEKEINLPFVISYGVESVPAFLFFNSEEELLLKQVGGKGCSDFLAMIDEVLDIYDAASPTIAINDYTLQDQQPNIPEYMVKINSEVTTNDNISRPTPNKFNNIEQEAYATLTETNANQYQYYNNPTQYYGYDYKKKNEPIIVPKPTNNPDIQKSNSIVMRPSSLDYDMQRLNTLHNQYRGGIENADMIKEYAYLLKKTHQPFDDVVNHYLQMAYYNNTLHLASNRKFVYDFANSLENNAMDLLIKDITYYKEQTAGDKVNKKIKSAIKNSIITAIETKNYNLLLKAEQTINDAYLSYADDFIFEMRAMFYEGVEDWNNYAKVVSNYIDSKPHNDPYLLSDVAYKLQKNIKNDRAMIEKALTWVQASIRMENEYYNNYILALLYYRLNNMEATEQAAKNAIYIAQLRNQRVDENDLEIDYSAAVNLLNHIKN